MKKRLMSLLLSAAMIMSMIVVPASAAETPIELSVDVTSEAIAPGGTVDVAVSIADTDDEREYAGLKFKLLFDPAILAPVDLDDSKKTVYAELGEVWAGSNFTQNYPKTVIDGKRYLAVNITNASGMYGTGVIATMQFQVVSDTLASEGALTLDVEKALYVQYNDDETTTDIDFAKNGELTVTNGAIAIKHPISVSTPDFVAEDQKSVSSVALNGTCTNDGTVPADKVDTYIKWGYAADAMNNTCEFGDIVTGVTEGAEVFYQAFAAVDGGATYSGAVKSFTMALAQLTTFEFVEPTTSIAVPAIGEEAKVVTYTVSALDQFGGTFPSVYPNEISWGESHNADPNHLISMENVDHYNVKVTVKPGAPATSLTLTAKYENLGKTATTTVETTREAPAVAEIAISGDSTVAVPTKSEYDANNNVASVTLVASGTDQYGDTISVPATWSIPATTGVSVANGVVTVDNTAAAGVVTVTATAGSANATFDLTITKADPVATTIEISGPDKGDIKADEANTLTYTAAVTDQFGDPMTAEIAWSVNSADVSVADGVLTVPAMTKTQAVVVTATAGAASDTIDVALTRLGAKADKVEISGEAAITLPDLATGSTSVNFTAVVTDNWGDVMPAAEITWAVSPAISGVSIDADGKLTVATEAGEADFSVTAKCGDAEDSFAVSVKKAASVATAIALPAESASHTIPTNETPNTKPYAAVVTDQYGEVMDVAVAYTLTGDDYVSVNETTGEVTVLKGATAKTAYTLKATYGDDLSDSMTITVVDIEVSFTTTPAEPSATYGTAWKNIVKKVTGTAMLDGVAQKGTYSLVNDATAIPDAGVQTYTLQFVSDAKDETTGEPLYVVTEDRTVDITPKALTLTWNAPKSITYTGELPAITATLKGMLTGDDVTVNVLGLVADAGTYEATAELAGADKDNYTLTTASKAYTIAKAKATITIADQTIRASKTSEQLAAQIGTIQADGVNGEKIDGVLTVTDDISGKTPSTKAQKVNVSFAHTNGNYETPVAGTVMVIFTEGDPQTIAVAPVNATYGDAAVANAATVTEGGAGAITYASSNEAVATVDAAGTVTIVGVGEATVTVTVAADGDWAETSTTYTVTVAPKAVTVSGITAADKAYDGKTDAVVDVTAAVVEGKVGQDDVTVASAKGAFADANAAAGKTVTISDIVLTGAAVKNYVLSDAAVTATASITKADVTVTLGGLKQSPDKVKDITVALNPAVEDATVKVEYYVAPVEEIPCDHVGDKLCTNDGTDCPHTDECGCSYAPGVDGYWTEDITNVQAKGEYPIRVTVSGSANVNDVVIDNAGVLVVKKSSSGGGGGSAPVEPPVEDEEEDEKFFIDVDENAWYYGAVKSMLDKGLMAGVSEDKFAPDMNLTRSMVVQILWAMAGKPVVDYTMSFEDVTAGAWYTEAVRWAASEGVASGYSAEAFGPNDAVTREQLAVMLYAYARKNNVDVSVGENTNILSYNDAFSISEWAIPAMQWACGEGLISGTPAGDLMPVSVATRAQVAVILNNFSDLING